MTRVGVVLTAIGVISTIVYAVGAEQGKWNWNPFDISEDETLSPVVYTETETAPVSYECMTIRPDGFVAWTACSEGFESSPVFEETCAVDATAVRALYPGVDPCGDVFVLPPIGMRISDLSVFREYCSTNPCRLVEASLGAFNEYLDSFDSSFEAPAGMAIIDGKIAITIPAFTEIEREQMTISERSAWRSKHYLNKDVPWEIGLACIKSMRPGARFKTSLGAPLEAPRVLRERYDLLTSNARRDFESSSVFARISAVS